MLSKILYGKKGSSFDDAAFSFVRKALCLKKGEANCDCYCCQLALSAMPDYRIYDKDSYLVDDVEDMIAFAQSSPVLSNVRVAYIKNFSSITEVSQNKLLKELEDNDHFLMIATADNISSVLPTIRSRTESSFVHKGTYKAFKDALGNDSDADILYEITEGQIGLVDEMRPQIPVYKAVSDAIVNRNKKKLFEAVHFVVDKDKECFIEQYPAYLPNLFDYMAATLITCGSYMLPEVIGVMKVINAERNNALCKWYKRTDFFTSIARIAEAISNEDKTMKRRMKNE